ncbi:MAG: carboxypeptidase-like regulatory domain-containing protein [Gemmatimonas sp.]
MSRAFALRFRVIAATLTALAVAVGARATEAQTLELRGVVRDSASGNPVSGVVVLALDAFGTTLGRTITGARGQYHFSRPQGAVLVRAIHIGYRATTERLPLIAAEQLTIDLSLATLPQQLEGVSVVAARGCPVRDDRNVAFALLEQARAGLLATVVARERQPAELLVLRFERELDLDGIEIERQTVRIDSSKNATTSFNAVRNAVDFVERGFREGAAGQYTYYGPDAEVLLDEKFQRGYCFSLAAADTARRSQLGLRFVAANHRDGRVDIDGTVWIDTAARALTDIEFRYTGVEAMAEAFNAGGRVSFKTLPSGAAFIHQWLMRLVGGNDMLETGTGSRQQYAVREVGGELARARWPDGETWLGPQGSIHITAAMHDGRIANGTRLNLVGTDYRAITDSTGRATINFVLPGPYTFAIDDPALAPIGLQIPAGRTFTAQRGQSAITRLTIPSAMDHVGALCGTKTPSFKDTWLIARVMGSDGRPAAGVHWRAAKAAGAARPSAGNGDLAGMRVFADNGATESDGLILICEGLVRNSQTEVAVWRDPKDAVKVRRIIEDALTVTRIQLPSLVPVAVATSKTRPTTPTIVAAGTVRDSTTGAVVADARVTFVGTSFEGSTDGRGLFVIGGLAAGEYTIEVSTPWLDSIGAVSRASVSLSSEPKSLALFIPSRAAIMLSACGSTDSAGFVAGNIGWKNSGALPTGLHVIAEWNSPVAAGTSVGAPSRTMWQDASVNSSGTFRVCGIPIGTRVVLRTESDSVSLWGAAPREIALPVDRSFARVDLQLDSLVSTVATIVGLVVSDSIGTPVENVEVTLTDIGRTVMTNARGAFRVSDIPAGPHLLSVKRVGFAPFLAAVDVSSNRVLEQRVQLSGVSTLSEVKVETEAVSKEFLERQARGVGKYLDRAALEKQRGRRLGDVISQVGGFGSMISGSGAQAYIVGKRAPAHILTGGATVPAGGGQERAGLSGGGARAPRQMAVDDVRDMGIYCPTAAEKSAGIRSCSCFAQVYVDGRLMNKGRPTEPFDANTLPVDDVVGVEFYGSAATTPSQYSQLGSVCGVMLVWMRR